MDTSGNVYTIVYASVMVIVVAFLLAFISSVLKPTQDANVENDTKGQILTSLNIDIKAPGFNVADEFENVQDMLWNGTELTPYTGKFLSSYGSAIKAGELHVFVAQANGETKYVLPVTGRGLWGGLWGYIALNADKKTVYGTYFYHESETAGLGARIGERWFQEQFNGKPVFAEGNTETVELKVVKAGASKAETEVDGVTGATLTSVGVSDMVQDGLSVYLSFINN
ncbi:MAG: FMN-binding protein [Bacteroidaceae bacterium]|nr:FMN-binding protein [Bacteroidaceae bacterium]MBQ3129671.1 FMN-binding protein [Bacteroidaceae bacterium]MEE0119565.1 FMN-binding protein [Bacteroidaceae bacterium]